MSRQPNSGRFRLLARRSRADRSAAEDLGARLLALVAEARAAGIDPEQALRETARRVATEPG